MAGTCVDDLVNKRDRQILFGTSLVQILEISTYPDGTLPFCLH